MSPLRPIQWYFKTLWSLNTRPGQFFRSLEAEGSYSRPLVFALVTHWIAAAFSFLWKSAFGSWVDEQWKLLYDFAQNWAVEEVDSIGSSHFTDNWAALDDLRMRWGEWVLGTSSVLIDPIITLEILLFSAFFVYIGARILITPGKNNAPAEITFASAVQIICYSSATAWLSVIPGIGTPLSHFFGGILGIIGARYTYRCPLWVACTVALFPKLLLVGLVFVGLLIVAIGLFKLVLSLFSF